MSVVLVVGRDEWNRTDVASTPVTSTVRACGTPSASAVANVIIGWPDSATHRANTAIGSSPARSSRSASGTAVHHHDHTRILPDPPEPVGHQPGVAGALPQTEPGAPRPVAAQLQLDRAPHHVQELVPGMRVELR